MTTMDLFALPHSDSKYTRKLMVVGKRDVTDPAQQLLGALDVRTGCQSLRWLSRRNFFCRPSSCYSAEWSGSKQHTGHELYVWHRTGCVGLFWEEGNACMNEQTNQFI